jgi:hypothetical protein
MKRLAVNNWVWVLYSSEQKFKLGRGWQGPYLVKEKLGPVNYLVQESPGSRTIPVHIDHLRHYKHIDTPPS